MKLVARISKNCLVFICPLQFMGDFQRRSIERLRLLYIYKFFSINFVPYVRFEINFGRESFSFGIPLFYHNAKRRSTERHKRFLLDWSRIACLQFIIWQFCTFSQYFTHKHLTLVVTVKIRYDSKMCNWLSQSDADFYLIMISYKVDAQRNFL